MSVTWTIVVHNDLNNKCKEYNTETVSNTGMEFHTLRDKDIDNHHKFCRLEH